MTLSARVIQSRGFTMLELLMAIGVLAVLVTFSLSSFPGIQMTTRDTKRKSDIKQYASLLESFGNRSNGMYVSYNGNIALTSTNTVLCTALGVSGACPYDPKDPDATYQYHYVSNGTGGGTASATQYVLYARLEKQTAGSNWYWVTCSNGQSGRAPLTANFTGATCPALQQ